jgi:hypothetical protein
MKIKSWCVPDVSDFEIFGGSVVSWFYEVRLYKQWILGGSEGSL